MASKSHNKRVYPRSASCACMGNLTALAKHHVEHPSVIEVAWLGGGGGLGISHGISRWQSAQEEPCPSFVPLGRKVTPKHTPYE